MRRILLAALAAALVLPASAPAAELLNQTLTVPAAGPSDCTTQASGRGILQRRVDLAAPGAVAARLTADSGDWDVAIFEARNGRLVSNGSAFGANELASGFVARPGELVVQACRRKGTSSTAKLTVLGVPLPNDYSPEKASLLKVKTPTRADKARLQALNVDLTEHAGHDYIEVVAYGEADRRRLRDAGFDFTVSVDDLVAKDLERAIADRRYARQTRRSPLPSGRDEYRRLGDIEAELKALAERHPTLVKPITLAHKSVEGRDVVGVEITEDAANVGDGKPVFLQMGVHHAREWPSAEMPMEFANELVNGYGKDERVTRLMKRVRVIFIPVVNPDGFNISREAPVDLLNDPQYEEIPDKTLSEEAQFAAQNAYLVDPFFNYKRRNCRLFPGQDAPPGLCATPQFRTSGVDPNRNYGGFWGGPGASALPLYDTYRGDGPFSEPETQNIRELVSARQVTNLITNHTFSNLILRPPGIKALGPTPDEPAYKALGERMAAQNGYFNDFSYGLYDTSGTTEDWTYTVTGGWGFTFEIGPDTVEQNCGGFHPAYECVVRHYTTGQNDGGGGNREAYFISMEHAADAANHSRLVGRAPAGVTLRVKKNFVTETSPVEPLRTDAPFTDAGDPGGGQPSPQQDKIEFEDKLDTTMTVPSGDRFEWDINPSTRPVVATNRYRTVSEEPTRTVEFSKDKQTTPATEGTPTEANYEDETFDVKPEEAGFTLIVDLQGTGADDYDIELFHVVNGEMKLVGESGEVPGLPEQIILENPDAGNYVLRVYNYLAFGPYSGTASIYGLGPEVVKDGTTEVWEFTCEAAGTVLAQQKILIGRGETLDMKEPCGANAREVAAAAFAAAGQENPAGGPGGSPEA
ncbi:MAG: M14 family metallopeptidase, partial [Actinomycetota bacterium]|nr:M14 family metallopeptidase [Actinomycetota bacterium]